MRFSNQIFFRAAFVLGLLFSLIAAAPNVSGEERPAAGTQRRFFSDDILVYGKDSSGQDFLLDIMLCRKEDAEKSSFIHYRFVSLLYGSTNKHFTESVYDPRLEEIASGAVTSFENRGSSDLSTRESYSFTVVVNGEAIQVRIPELEGDFIIKNSPEYTKYVSESPATVQIGGKSIAARAMVAKIHSSDFNKYVFFPGHGKTDSETHSMILWDEKGNFYAIDSSRVQKDNPAYRSHSWVLLKDTTTKTMRKGFDVNVSLKEENGKPKSWLIILPTLDGRKIRLDALSFKEGKNDEGFAAGNVSAGGSETGIRGLFVHHMYRDE